MKDDLSLWVAGFGDQLGLGNDGLRTTLTRVPGLSSVVSVSVGDCHTAVLTSSGQVWTSGCNFMGELGFDSSAVPELSAFRLVPLPSPHHEALAVAVAKFCTAVVLGMFLLIKIVVGTWPAHYTHFHCLLVAQMTARSRSTLSCVRVSRWNVSSLLLQVVSGR